ncbi:MAG: hypothetical protein PHO42_05625 [Candidatus Omnitrophica bacterium]|nr:hypothetical protein [Candidatus Omnitrophota bacterium]
MIKINLAPEEVKKEQKPKTGFEFEMPKLDAKFLKPAVYVLAGLIGLHILFGLSIAAKAVSLGSLNAKLQRLQPQRLEVEAVDSNIKTVEKTVLPIRQLIEKKVAWAKELNELSDSMTPGIWLTKLFIETQAKDAAKGEYARVLTLEGSAASLYGDETALVAKFVKALQTDKDFSRYFSELKLGPMEKGVLENIPVMNFKVYCFFKKNA